MTMKTWARLSGNVVVELQQFDATLVPGQDVPALWTDDVTSVSGIAVGWVKSGGSFVAPPPSMVSPAVLMASASAKLSAILATGKTFDVGGASVLCDGTSDTRADLAMLALYGQQSPTGQKSWVDNTGATTVLTGTQLLALATAAGTWIDDGYAALGAAFAAINASPPTITTAAQVDTAMASF